MPAVTILSSEHVSWQTWQTTDVGYGSGVRLFNTLSAASFVTGHRYLLFFKGLVGGMGAASSTRAEIHHGGVEIAKLSGTYGSDSSTFGFHPYDGFAIIIGDDTKDVQLFGRHQGLSFYQSRAAGTQLLAIDLDTTDATLIENTDWFYSENTIDHSSIGDTFVSTQSASITFTPDGVSDYLVIGDITWSGLKQSHAMRLYDVTAALRLNIAGGGSAQNAVNDNYKNMVMSVLEAPPASSRTIRVEYKSTTTTKDNAQIFVLRLNAFKSYGFTQQYLNGVSPVTRNIFQSIGSFNYTPDSTGNVILLASMRAYTTPSNPEQYGLGGRLLYNAIEVAVTSPVLGTLISGHSSTYSNIESNVQGATFASLLTGKSGVATIDAEIKGNNAFLTNIGVELTQQTLIAFGTELNDVSSDRPGLSGGKPFFLLSSFR